MVGDSVPYSPAMTLDPLRRAAEVRGVATHYIDATDNDHQVADGTLRAVLAAMGEEPPASGASAWPPVVVARMGRPHAWRPPAGSRAVMVLESGEERPLPDGLPSDLPPGRHLVEGRGGTAALVAPGRYHLLVELAADPRLRRVTAMLSNGVNGSQSQAERKS
jgi:hypothetical protein